MKARPERAERERHWQQSHPNSCLPACLAIAMGFRGQAPALVEAQLHQHAFPGGHSIYDRRFLELTGVRKLNLAADRGALDQLRAALAGGAVVVLDVSGPRWVQTLPQGTTGPFGQLCPGGRGAQPIHAVAVVDWAGDSFFVLDPYYTASNQPFEVSDDELLDALVLLALVVDK